MKKHKMRFMCKRSKKQMSVRTLSIRADSTLSIFSYLNISPMRNFYFLHQFLDNCKWLVIFKVNNKGENEYAARFSYGPYLSSVSTNFVGSTLEYDSILGLAVLMVAFCTSLHTEKESRHYHDKEQAVFVLGISLQGKASLNA